MKEIYLLHAKTKEYRYKLLRSIEIVESALRISEKPYVSLSGGKDSTVVYSIVRSFIDNIPAVWSDDEWWLPETLEYIRRLQESGLDVRQIRTNSTHTEWFSVTGDYDGIPDYARQNAFDLVFLGLREEENNYRRIHLRKMGQLFKAKSDGFWHCNPIGKWSYKDVWAYIYSNDLDYNNAYNKLDAIDIDKKYQRVGPLAVEKALYTGQLTILKKGWPELYNRFCLKYPEAKLY